MSPGDEGTKILVVDDNESELEALSKILTKAGYQVSEAEEGQKGFSMLRKGSFDLLITDLQMPGMGGEELLRLAKTVGTKIEVIIIAGHGTIEDAVEAIKSGAYDFIEKPVKRYQLLKIVEKALEKQQLIRRNEELSRLVEENETTSSLVGTSPNFIKALELAKQVALSEATVLIQGESGTGKELFADTIQKWSPRRGRPFVKLNCAAIPETLLESELFGYEKGAFTGAYVTKPGRFELAHTGTLFLDEVGEMSPALQAKLLRVLENGEFQHVGGTKGMSADVRILAATHADLAARVKEKGFREDLYYRLNVIQIILPPLRELRQDIPLLAHHFLRIYNRKNGRNIQGFKKEALEILERYFWPGNVRELENAVERAVVLCSDPEIAEQDLPPHLSLAGSAKPGYLTFSIGTPLDEVEQTLIEETLKLTQGDKEAAAKLLGTSSRTLYRRLRNSFDTLSRE